jgi:copper chaperone CopZ
MLKFFKKEETVNENQVVYRIDGMSCNHCKNSVEKAIKALDNVEDVEVVLGKKEAVVTGNPNDEIVKKTVEELGFEFKGRK